MTGSDRVTISLLLSSPLPANATNVCIRGAASGPRAWIATDGVSTLSSSDGASVFASSSTGTDSSGLIVSWNAGAYRPGTSIYFMAVPYSTHADFSSHTDINGKNIGYAHVNAVGRWALLPFAPPFGYVDTPINGTSGLAGAIGVTGWCLSGFSIQTISVWRERFAYEPPGRLVFIGNAEIVPDARPDVAQANPGYPRNNSGWGLQILTNELPNSNGTGPLGHGTYNLHVLVTDYLNRTVDLGIRTIIVDNADSVLPFGTIDTPAQGGKASGTQFLNFGWVLTQQPNVVPFDGSTIWVYIDDQAVGHSVFNNYRFDITTLFPGYANSQGAVGYYYIDTTQLTNGLHTIAWSATNSARNAQGLGSRFFNVQN